METFSALLVTGGFPSQRPVTQSFDVFFDLRLNKRTSKQPDADDTRRHRAHYDATVMILKLGQTCFHGETQDIVITFNFQHIFAEKNLANN